MEPAMHFDLERYSRLWTDRRCGRSRLALSETIHVLLWVKVSPEMDQGQNSTRVGRNHLSRDILPFWCPYLSYHFLLEPSRVGFLVSAVVLRFYWNIQVWTFSTTEVILLQVTNDEFLGCRLCFSLLSHLYSGKKSYFLWQDALWWSRLVYLGRTQGARKTQNKIKTNKARKTGHLPMTPTCGNVCSF